MKTEKEVLLALLAKTHNIGEQEVSSLLYQEDGTLKPDAFTTLETMEAERIKRLRESDPQQSVKFAQAKAAAKAELMQEWENDFKSLTGLASDKKGKELVKEFISSVNAKMGEPIDEQKIKTHPLYLSLQESSQLAIAQAKQDADDKLNQFKSQHEREKVFGEISGMAIERLMSRKPILSSDPMKARNQQRLLLDELNSFEFEKQTQGDRTRTIIKKAGQLVEDTMGHPMSIEKLVDSISDKYYDFSASDNRSSPPGGGSGGSGSPVKFVVRKPKNDDDFAKQYDEIRNNKDLTPVEKAELGKELVRLRNTEEQSA